MFFGSVLAQDLGDGRKTVTAAGSAEKLVAAGTPISWVIISAFEGNTGTVVVGSSTVVADAAIRRGAPLNKGDSIGLSVSDLSQIYLDVTVNGEGVSFIYGY